ncbi:MAG: hypothetical protein IT302_00625 [Dehalococcoidia bacterium]|nr:hypothetical protein [Dehalococcoidia bacterium]
MPLDLPEHVTSRRRDGRREVMLHRSMAVIGDEKIEIKAARSTVWVPLGGLALSGLFMWWIGTNQGSAPVWALILMLLFLLFAVPVSAMSLVSSIAGADVVADRRKNSVTWQQGYLGMGIGTKELVPFERIDHLEISVEGEDRERWHEEQDSLRQFALTLVKKSGKRLTLAQVPVPADDQADGMDRTMAVGQAFAQLTGTEVRLPEGWELIEIDTQTLEPVARGGAKARRGRKRK